MLLGFGFGGRRGQSLPGCKGKGGAEACSAKKRAQRSVLCKNPEADWPPFPFTAPELTGLAARVFCRAGHFPLCLSRFLGCLEALAHPPTAHW